MKARLSNHINLPTDRFKEAEQFYERVLGLQKGSENANYGHVTSGDRHLYFDSDTSTAGPILEFVVADLEAAKRELIEAGCTILRWDGIGKPNYVKDPFGFVFNVFEEKEN